MCEVDYASLCPNQAKKEKLRSARPHIEIDYRIVLLQSASQGWVTLLIAEQRKDEARMLDILRSDDLIAWCIWLPSHSPVGYHGSRLWAWRYCCCLLVIELSLLLPYVPSIVFRRSNFFRMILLNAKN